MTPILRIARNVYRNREYIRIAVEAIDIHQPPKKSMCIGARYAIVVMTRRGSCVKLNDDYTLARVPCGLCPLPLFLFLLVYSFFSVRPLRISTSTTQSRGKHGGEDVLRNRWPLSNIFLPASLALTIALVLFSRVFARARRIRRYVPR